MGTVCWMRCRSAKQPRLVSDCREPELYTRKSCQAVSQSMQSISAAPIRSSADICGPSKVPHFSGVACFPPPSATLSREPGGANCKKAFLADFAWVWEVPDRGGLLTCRHPVNMFFKGPRGTCAPRSQLPVWTLVHHIKQW